MKQNNCVRCEGCSFVFSKKEAKCPKCEKPLEVNEDFNKQEDVFNLCD